MSQRAVAVWSRLVAAFVIAGSSGSAIAQQAVEADAAGQSKAARDLVAPDVVTVIHEVGKAKERTSGFYVDGVGTVATVLSLPGAPGQLKVVVSGKEYPTKILAQDPYTRLILLKAEGAPERAPAAAMGRSCDLSVGDYAFAIAPTADGVPSAVAGRVAGREKDFMGRTLAASLIRLNMTADTQTFGAPLADSSGAICGIVLLGMEDGKAGVCYALPAELIGKFMRDIARHGKIVEGWIGFGMEAGTTTPEVRVIYPDSPAEKSGLQIGDIIHSIGDRKVRDYQDVVDACYYLTPGEEIAFGVLRGLDDASVVLTPVVRDEKKKDGPTSGSEE